jgi:3-ketosteroid 9alpha-monooxygenase subunit B
MSFCDPARAGVPEAAWREATQHCFRLRVASVTRETPDAISIELEIPTAQAARFAYRAGQFVSFKLPWQGQVLTRSYSLASSPETEREHRVAVKRVAEGRVSNWLNDSLRVGDELMVVPPAGLFVLSASARPLLFFAGGSGITPVISLIKTALATTSRRMQLVYANRDARAVLYGAELDALASAHPSRLCITHSLDDKDGFLDAARARALAGAEIDRDFYLCGPAAFMDIVEAALREQGVSRDRIHIERFISPTDHAAPSGALVAAPPAEAPDRITVVLDGKVTELDYQPGERVLAAARRAGLNPPFSCEEGYCSCCMAKLVSGRVEMAANDCLTPELLEEGWVLTCQARCTASPVRIEYPD